MGRKSSPSTLQRKRRRSSRATLGRSLRNLSGVRRQPSACAVPNQSKSRIGFHSINGLSEPSAHIFAMLRSFYNSSAPLQLPRSECPRGFLSSGRPERKRTGKRNFSLLHTVTQPLTVCQIRFSKTIYLLMSESSVIPMMYSTSSLRPKFSHCWKNLSLSPPFFRAGTISKRVAGLVVDLSRWV
jgi:hypothetical protein